MAVASEIGERVRERYRLESVLGQGGFGTTFAALDEQSGLRVAVKQLRFDKVPDWKAIDLFERESRVLRSLEHPGIPAYIDSFQELEADGGRLYLVQELAAGQSLGALVGAGWRCDADEAREIAGQVLEILIYLHGLSPPVIHRDIKPENLIRSADGSIMLVDFGSVRDTVNDAIGSGSTVVGTFGYMAPEQFQGRALPATDQYGLGATILFLLTHTHPSALPHNGLALDVDAVIDASSGLAEWLRRVLAIDPNARFADANAALDALTAGPAGAGVPAHRADAALDRVAEPVGTRVELRRDRSELEIVIPPGRRGQAAATLGFSCVWLGFIAFWTFLSVVGGAPWFFSAFSIPFWLVGFGLLRSGLKSIFEKVRLKLTPTQFELVRETPIWASTVTGRIEDLHSVERLTTTMVNQRPVWQLDLIEGVRRHRLDRGLTEQEHEWLGEAIAEHADIPYRHHDHSQAQKLRPGRRFGRWDRGRRG